MAPRAITPMRVRLTRENLSGVWAALSTPFDASDRFDEEAFRENVRRLAAAGVHGAYTTDSDGEFYAIEFDEYRRIIDVFADESQRLGLPTQVGVTWSHTRGIVDRLQYAAERGILGAHVGHLWDGKTVRVPSHQSVSHACAVLDLLLLARTALRAACRCRGDLVLENLLLRHQLAVLTRPTRQRKRVHFRQVDRLLWVLVRRLRRDWRRHLVVVTPDTPDTVVRWHRAGWRLYWRWRSRSRSRGGRPRLSPEVRDLIGRASSENPLWGSERIRDELLKLGIVVSNRSIRRYRSQRAPQLPSQSWRTFLGIVTLSGPGVATAGQKRVGTSRRAATPRRAP